MYTVFASAPLFAELQRRGWFPDWLAILLGVLAIVAVGVLYIKEAGRLGLIPRVVMAAVRTLIVLVVAFLLMRPVWVTEEKGERARPIAVLIDISQSMDSKDPRPSPADLGRAAIAFGFADADKGLPDPSFLTSLQGNEKLQRPSRIDIARSILLQSKINFLPRLARLGPLQVYTFGMNRTGRDPSKHDWLKNLTAEEPRTALVESAFELLNKDDSEAPAAIVLVTDGRENAGPRSLDDLGRECARRKIPIYIYGVGSSTFGQLQTAFGSAASDKPGGSRVGADIDVPNTLFVDDTAAIPIRYTVKGLSEGIADIVLKYGDRVVATSKERFTLNETEKLAGKTFASVLKFVPTKEDADSKKQEYSVTVTVSAGNGPGADIIANEISRPASVVNRKLKLLWVDSLPRRDFQFLQRELLRDRRVDAKFYLTEGDKQAMHSGPPWMIEFSAQIDGALHIEKDEFRKLLFEFDLLILGDVPGKFFNDEHKSVIAEFVKQGGGLIHIAGRWHAPHDWAEDKIRLDEENKGRKESEWITPLADLLPVDIAPVRFPIQALDNPTGFVPVLAPAASRTQIVSLEDDPIDNAELWGKPGPPPVIPNDKLLKELFWYYPVIKVKPAADVFLTHPTARTPAPDNKPMPLLVGHHYGQGYVLFVGFDDTWRWRFNNQNRLMGRFWTQAIYTVGVPRIVGTRQTQISSNTPTPLVGTTGEVYLRAFNEDFQPLRIEEIVGTLEKLDASPNEARFFPVEFHKVPGVDGEYVATLPYNNPGQYKLSVDPKNSDWVGALNPRWEYRPTDAKNKNPATLNFPVNYPINHELAPGALDEPAMRKLAEATGGKFYREEDVIKLPAEAKPQPSPFYQKEELLLWNQWAMILLIGLLTLEWFLRKFNGLS